MRVKDRLRHSWYGTGLAFAISLATVGSQLAYAAVTQPVRVFLSPEQSKLERANSESAKPEQVNSGPSKSELTKADPLRHGKTCVSGDPDYLCLGVKYVLYVDSSSQQPVISPDAVENNFSTINSIWKQCKIGFQVDDLILKNPETAGLPVETADFSDLDRIRQAFNEESSLLIVTTYKWKRDGNLGHTPANAWTKMPGSGLYGVIMEQKVGTFPNIIAHELGHYLNLYHASENTDVMNAIIYNNSKVITQEQCATARAAAKKWWPNMLRHLPAATASPQQLATEPTSRTRKS